jgi:hypothetical protein
LPSLASVVSIANDKSKTVFTFLISDVAWIAAYQTAQN